MGKRTGCIIFFLGSDGKYYMLEKYDYVGDPKTGDYDSDISKKEIGKSNVEINYEDGETAYSLKDKEICIEFNRSDGSVKSISTTKAVISVKKGKREYIITVDQLTGRVTLTSG